MDYPEGKIFDLDKAQKKFEKMKEDGWVDTPALLDLPPKQIEIEAEKAKNMAPDELIGLVKSMGFVVMTPEELQAEIAKAVASSLDDPLASNDEVSDELMAMAKVFSEDPEALTKDELIVLGKSFDVPLTKAMKEATMIEKITEAQDALESKD